MALHRRVFPETGKPPVFGKKAELSITVCIISAIGDNTMVNSRALLNNTYSPYFTPYTFISLILPCGLLSLNNTFSKESITAECCRSSMLSHCKIKVIKCPSESF